MARRHSSDALYDGTTEPYPGPRRADGVSNRERLLDAARALFAESGALTTMEAVAEKAGVGKATAYRSFPNRDALVAAVAVRQYAEVRALVLEVIEREAEPGPRFAAVVRALFDYNRRHSLYVEIDRLDDPPPMVREAQSAVRRPIIDLVDQCREAGLVRVDVTSDDLFHATIAYTLAFGRRAVSARQWRRAAELTLVALGSSEADPQA
ncbi:TetR/AcrR family transcriptional regulator [Nocardioides sp. TF02-7]|uniref:TetR/AcrR family transcriptional regulator n=1 Tax=Nocardioides sp. TF02-7 TaxID=2917724 RepID=UPI001F0509F6|nr:TetR/AcrR family transcriptional regulator [Nocardioides sp. TF02-7]UMG91229.1 TetR/AcrR family transcriptional regulator [Nocardioides sp. TF02-7]